MNLSEYVSTILARRIDADDPLPIVQTGHPALRDRAREWSGQLPAEQLRALIDAMVVTMRDAPGVGLAAPQVGIPLSLVVIEDAYAQDDDEDDPLDRRPVALRALLDPQYRPVGETRTFFWEGCLSVSGYQSIIPRHRTVDWSALEVTPDGSLAEVSERWTGWPARIMQHETDHLDGTLCHDLAVPRSFIDDRYAHHYGDLGEAVDRLGLTGDVARLGPGEVDLG